MPEEKNPNFLIAKALRAAWHAQLLPGHLALMFGFLVVGILEATQVIDISDWLDVTVEYGWPVMPLLALIMILFLWPHVIAGMLRFFRKEPRGSGPLFFTWQLYGDYAGTVGQNPIVLFLLLVMGTVLFYMGDAGSLMYLGFYGLAIPFIIRGFRISYAPIMVIDKHVSMMEAFLQTQYMYTSELLRYKLMGLAALLALPWAIIGITSVRGYPYFLAWLPQFTPENLRVLWVLFFFALILAYAQYCTAVLVHVYLQMESKK